MALETPQRMMSTLDNTFFPFISDLLHNKTIHTLIPITPYFPPDVGFMLIVTLLGNYCVK